MAESHYWQRYGVLKQCIDNLAAHVTEVKTRASAEAATLKSDADASDEAMAVRTSIDSLQTRINGITIP